MAFDYSSLDKEELSFEDAEIDIRERPQISRIFSWRHLLVTISIVGNIYLLLPSFLPTPEENIPIDYGGTKCSMNTIPV
jgi:hypothetical protein